MYFMFISVHILLLFSFAKGNEEDLRKIDEIYQEAPCSSAGGICVIAADCPRGHLSERRGLCPEQRAKGVECCYGISMKETRCIKHGGTCKLPKSYCNPKLIFDDVTDCPGDTRCCIMTL